MACGAQMLLCLIALAVLPSDRLLSVVVAQQSPQDPADVLDVTVPPDPADDSRDGGPTAAPECREEQFPCTRLYSVHKPVKQCISYLCVVSVRRTYMINKEICSRIVCKEDEAMQGCSTCPPGKLVKIALSGPNPNQRSSTGTAVPMGYVTDPAISVQSRRPPQEEICRQMAGLPPRRLRRSGQPRRLPCRQAQKQQQNTIGIQ